MDNNTKKITTTAMLSAIAYVVVVVGRIPVVLFLKYDPKDIIITLGGLIWGPLTFPRTVSKRKLYFKKVRT